MRQRKQYLFLIQLVFCDGVGSLSNALNNNAQNIAHVRYKQNFKIPIDCSSNVFIFTEQQQKVYIYVYKLVCAREK